MITRRDRENSLKWNRFSFLLLFSHSTKEKFFVLVCLRVFSIIFTFSTAYDEWGTQVESQVFSSLKFSFRSISTINYFSERKKVDIDFPFVFFNVRIHFSIAFINAPPEKKSRASKAMISDSLGDDAKLQLQFVISSRKTRRKKEENSPLTGSLIFSLLVTFLKGGKEAKQHQISRNSIIMRVTHLWTKASKDYSVHICSGFIV